MNMLTDTKCRIETVLTSEQMIPPKSDTQPIWLLCAWSRPEMVGNVVANYQRQRKSNCRLAVAVTHDSVTAQYDLRHHVRDALILTPPGKHQSIAKNALLKAILPGEKWATFDDDDYYGEWYASEISSAIQPGLIVGKSQTFVTTSDNRLRLIDFHKV